VNRARTRVLVLGALVGALAVGALARPAFAAGGHPPDTERSTEVATVTRGSMTLTFLAEPGSNRIALREQGSRHAGPSPVAGLIAQKLTTQEIYLALAPRGSQAPAALQQAQAGEAARLGRDAAVRAAQVPVTAAAIGQQACANLVLPNDTQWYDYLPQTFASGSATQYVGGISSFSTTSLVGFGACNESDTAQLKVRYSYVQRWTKQGWTDNQTGDFPVGPGGYVMWYYAWEGYSAATGWMGASYRVTGTSNGSFDLVSGVSWQF